MKQIAFLIDVSWLQDEETTVAVRFACLQLLTAWPSSSCKFGYLLFNSEASRTQKVNAVNFTIPSSTAVSEFEAQLTEGLAATRTNTSGRQLETVRWAVSRSVTDFAWHSVTVCSPVKASRKRRIQGSNQDENRNMLFLFSQLPQGTISTIRDDLVTQSLAKCLQDDRIDLFWVHDSLLEAPASSKCLFLRMRDLIQLCGVFPPDSVQPSVSLAPRSKIVARLLQNSKPQPLAACTLSMNCLFNPIDLSVFATQSDTEVIFEAADMELRFDRLLEDPCVASLLGKTVAVYFVISRDAHFHRTLVELQALKAVCVLSNERLTYILKPIADSVGALVRVTDSDVETFESSLEAPLKSFDASLLERCFQAETNSSEQKNASKQFQGIDAEQLARLQETYKKEKQRQIDEEIQRTPVKPQEVVKEQMNNEARCFNSESALLQQMRLNYNKAREDKLSLMSAAQSIVSATVHFFESDLEKTRNFLETNFSLPLVRSELSNSQWANECRLFVFICFEMASLNLQNTTDVNTKTKVIGALRKLLFLTSPSDVFDFVRETLKNLYLDTVRPLLEEIAEEFDLPLFPDSDEELSSVADSFVEPLSGISSLGSTANSVPLSINRPEQSDPMRRMSSTTLSQRQIQMPKRRPVRVHETNETSPKKETNKEVPTTPRGKRVLKTQVVPETPVAKQAPGRVRRTQEMLRKRSSILMCSQETADDLNEIEESPIKPTTRSSPRLLTPRKSPRITPKKENLTRRLRFSPQKKVFTSPSAMSLLHLTTSPVLFKPKKTSK